jgi:succinate dehydrogenase / fumarate reductase cytochrome b subunit
MNDHDRPLSPHLSIYRWPITMIVSILHRITGAGLSLGVALLALWLVSAATGASAYDRFTGVLGHPAGQLLLLGWTFAFFLHLANGIRHLVWDTGRGLSRQQATTSAWFVIVAAVLLTAGYWILLASAS